MTEPEIEWNPLTVSQTEHHLKVYDVRFPQTKNRRPLPFPGRPEYSRTCNGRHCHFRIQNWGDSTSILEDHPDPLPKCKHCSKQFSSGRLNTCHYASENCKQAEEQRLCRQNLHHCLRQLWYCYISMLSPCHGWRPSPNLGGLPTTIIAISGGVPEPEESTETVGDDFDGVDEDGSNSAGPCDDEYDIGTVSSAI